MMRRSKGITTGTMGIINTMYLIEIKFEPGKIRLNLGMGKLITMFTYHKMWWGLEGSWYIRHALILNISPFVMDLI